VSLENNQPVKSDDNQEHSTKVDNSRRSFAKKSAAIAPVIMTLANRSAWGANACTGSVFNSFAAAETSHAAYQAVSAWRQPSSGMPISTSKLGWYESISEWPSTYAAATKQAADQFKSSLWSGNKSRSTIESEYPGIKFFVDQLGKFTSTPPSDLTIYDALKNSSWAYIVAAVLNQAKTPGIPFPKLVTDAELIKFYSNCI
jgi:hypothetical protein